AGSIAGLLIHPFNRFAMSRWGGVAAVPVYEIAYSGAMQVRSIFEAGGRALVPAVGQAFGELGAAAIDRIRALQRRATRMLVLASSPVFVCAALLAGPFLKILLRE